MRADAARNGDAVLHTGARPLAADPTISMAAIAAAAGVDRRTVYRRFASREALVAAVLHAKPAAAEQVVTTARLGGTGGGRTAPLRGGRDPLDPPVLVEIRRLGTTDEHFDARRRAVRARLTTRSPHHSAPTWWWTRC